MRCSPSFGPSIFGVQSRKCWSRHVCVLWMNTNYIPAEYDSPGVFILTFLAFSMGNLIQLFGLETDDRRDPLLRSRGSSRVRTPGVTYARPR